MPYNIYFFKSCKTENEVYNTRMKGTFHLRHEQERTTISIKRVALKQLILIITLVLIVGSFQICKLNQYSDAFIYSKPYPNDTRIIKVKNIKVIIVK